MRQVAIPRAFDPAAGTVDVSNVAGFDPRRVVAILDTSAPDRPTLYDLQTPGLGFASVAGAVMTLQCDTSGLSAQDWLIVFYDDGLSVGDAMVSIGAMLAPAALAANIATLSTTQLVALISALLGALPNTQKGASTPATGNFFIDEAGNVALA